MMLLPPWLLTGFLQNRKWWHFQPLNSYWLVPSNPLKQTLKSAFQPQQQQKQSTIGYSCISAETRHASWPVNSSSSSSSAACMTMSDSYCWPELPSLTTHGWVTHVQVTVWSLHVPLLLIHWPVCLGAELLMKDCAWIQVHLSIGCCFTTKIVINKIK